MEVRDEEMMPVPAGEYRVFLNWRVQKETLRQVRRVSWAFALAFFLETVLLFVTQNIAHTFWTALDMLNVFEHNALWELAEQLYATTYYLVIFLLPYLLYAKLAHFNLRDIPHGRPYAPVVLASTGFAMGASLAGTFLSGMALEFFYQFFGMNPPDFPGRPYGILALVLYLVNSVILPPVMEEVVYRGILLGSLRRYGDVPAVVISALVFGLAHGNMSQLPYSFVLGLIMAFFVVKTNSIYTGIFIHFVNNAIATFLEFFTENMSVTLTDMVYSMRMLVDLAAFILAIIYLVGMRRADWKLKPGATPGGAVARQFFFTAPMILVLLVMGWNILTSFT